MKTLEEFEFAQSPHIPTARVRALAEGGYLERSEPVLLVGEPGTGKTNLATGLAIAACRQRKRVRFTTAAGLVNQLVEAQREQSLHAGSDSRGAIANYGFDDFRRNHRR